MAESSTLDSDVMRIVMGCNADSPVMWKTTTPTTVFILKQKVKKRTWTALPCFVAKAHLIPLSLI